MDSQKRLMLALALSFVVVTLWTVFFGPKPPPPTPLGAVADAGAVAAEPAAIAAVPTAAPLADAGAALPPVVALRRDFSKVHVQLSTDGARLTQAELQGAKMREPEHYAFVDGLQHAFGAKHTDSPQVDLGFWLGAGPGPLAVSVEGATPFPAGARYAVTEDAPKRIVMVATSGTWRVTKQFEWSQDDGELFSMGVALENLSDKTQAGDLSIRLGRSVDPTTEEKGSFFGGVGNQWKAACRVADKMQKQVPNDKPPPEYPGAVDFFGVDQQYFIAAVIPQADQRDGKCTLYATSTERSVAAAFPVKVEPGQKVERTYHVFLGAKDSEALATIAAPGAAAPAGAGPHLETAVEFGLWVAICKVLLGIMKFFYGVFHNWGVAIILLTVLVKLVLLPLTHKQMVAAEQMKKLQPRIEEIKKKFPDDRERQNLETMKLYQEAKVNPLGGCLPILVQMPVWFALFTTLRNSFEIYREPFIAPLWADLTYKDPTYLLPLALGVTMILTQRLQPQMSMDPMQARMMTYVMPSFFTLLMLSYPAGLSLYIFTNNVLSIAQTYGLRRYIRLKEAKT